MKNILLLLATLALIVVMNPVRASASPAQPAQTVPAVPVSPGNTGNAVNTSVSRNWSGYAATNGTFTGVSGTWTVPTFNNAINYGNYGADTTWVGIGGVTNKDLIQAGTEAMVDGNGQMTYNTFFEELPNFSQPLPVSINGGDKVTVSINKQSGNQWIVTFKNNTTGQNYQTTVTYNSSLSSAEWIEEAPSTLRRIMPLDNFGSINFTDATAVKNGQTMAVGQIGAQPVTMADSYQNVLAVPSTLSNNGSSFTIMHESSQQTFSPGRGQSPSFILIYRFHDLY